MSQVPTKTQVSAGGVVYRRQGDRIEIALISVGEEKRWQLPKGLIQEGEPVEVAARREVREETGLEAKLVTLIDKIEYWYYSTGAGQRIRFHKFVYFYLLRYQSGDIQDHDHEVNEARWVDLDQAQAMLTFPNEQKIVAQAGEMIRHFAN